MGLDPSDEHSCPYDGTFEDRVREVVRDSGPEEIPGEAVPVWSAHVGGAILALNRSGRTDFALFMVAALTDPALVHQAPAIAGRAAPSAQAAGRG